MAATFLEPGTSATFDFSLFRTSSSSGGGTMSSDSSNTNGQARSFKIAGASGNSAVRGRAFTNDSVVSDAGGRMSFGFRMDAWPDSGQGGIALFATSGGTFLSYALCVNSSGQLCILDQTSGLTVGSTVLAVNTFYRISVAHVITGSGNNTIKVFLSAAGGGAATLEITATNLTFTTLGSSQAAWGMRDWNCVSGAKNIWITDMYTDDSSALTDPGDIHVTAKRPFANGTTNDFTITNGGTGYGSGKSQYVNDRPPFGNNYWIGENDTASPLTQEFTIEGKAVGDANISTATIVANMGWIQSVVTVSAETCTFVIGGDTSKTFTMDISRTTSSAMGPTTYPSGGDAIGLITAGTTANTCVVYGCGIVVAYKPAVLNNYSLTAGAGSFALSGQAAALKAARKITASVGSFAVSGQPAALKAGRKVTAAAGSFSMTGNAASFALTRKLTAAAGSFAVTGNAAGLRSTRILTASAGSFSISGQAAALRLGKGIIAAAGSFILTGVAAGLRATRKLTAAAGSFALTGQNAILARALKLTAASGSFAVSGQAANLTIGRKLTAAAGSFAISGQAAGLRATRKLTAAAGSFLMTGNAATLTKTSAGILLAGQGSFVVTGNAAALKAARKITATAGSFSISGQAANLRRGRTLTAANGSFSITGNPATFQVTRRLTAGAGAFSMTGNPANLTFGGVTATNGGNFFNFF